MIGEKASPWLSVVIPVRDELANLRPLGEELGRALGGWDYEVIFVDDGSRDGSAQVLEEMAAENPRLRIISFGRSFGKSVALAVGFKEARGEAIVTMDGDLQDDPEDIPRLLAGLEQGYDLISGWKVHRHDPWTKRWPSRLFNAVTARLTGLDLHDINCGFKAYRRPVTSELSIYGERHRFVPVLAYWKGFRVGEIGVRHRPRLFGRSKFGMGRFLAGLLDLFTVIFLTRFRSKPLHLFGAMGLGCIGVSLVINGYLTVQWLGGERIGTRPLLQLGVLLMVMGIQFLSLGLLGEMITQGKDREEPVYRVREPEVGKAKTGVHGPGG